MKRLLTALCASAGLLSAAASGPGSVDGLAAALERGGCYADTVRFTVSMPQLAEDVVYTVAMRQDAAAADSLMPCAYLIDWTMHGEEPDEGATPANAAAARSTGFSAYFAGHHYRYGSHRLQEYHWAWDSVPFQPRRLGGMRADGVQRTAQFANLLPAVIAADLRRMDADTAWRITLRPDTIVGGRHLRALLGRMEAGGITAVEAEYLFDPSTGMPVRISLENSPGTISEQSVTALYGPAATGPAACPPLDEDALMALYPEPFGRFRTSSFRAESLPGSPLPAFSLPTSTGERFTRHADSQFPTPVILALLDPQAGFTAPTVEAVRTAAASLPEPATILWALTTSNIDLAEQTIGAQLPDERILISARGLARDCGAASLPTLLIVRPDGIIADVMVGYTPDMATLLAQRMLAALTPR